ncbi:GspMb/PilO family protein [uncultured Pseudomonas sp.]|uniref:GspMb/PilO family protein n=1 Tax=uncultured Pseudomonas sp. TaxID=114707 RepID=UPI0025E20623|nr:GspMb/PilO family protein [uncultured Pseudomonas sp.]
MNNRFARLLALWLPRLRWQTVRVQQALGFWGLLAVGVIVVSGLIDLTLIGPAFEQDTLRRQAIQAGIDERPQDVHVTAPVMVEKLPTAQAFAPRLEKVLLLIQQHGFIIDQTSLAYSAPGDSGVQRLDIDVPLSGSYPALRQALAAVAQEPGVRIENLTLERQEINTPHLAIGLKLSMLGVEE